MKRNLRAGETSHDDHRQEELVQQRTVPGRAILSVSKFRVATRVSRAPAQGLAACHFLRSPDTLSAGCSKGDSHGVRIAQRRAIAGSLMLKLSLGRAAGAIEIEEVRLEVGTLSPEPAN